MTLTPDIASIPLVCNSNDSNKRQCSIKLHHSAASQLVTLITAYNRVTNLLS